MAAKPKTKPKTVKPAPKPVAKSRAVIANAQNVTQWKQEAAPTAISTMALVDAYVESLKRIQADASMNAATTSAGLILDPGKKGEQHGVQVFVKVIRYSDAWLTRAPHNGGLAVRP